MSKKLSLDKILQSQGFGTRKWCAELIADGEVSINGQVIRDSRASIATDGLQFTIFDELWTYREHVYIALNKPANYECSRKASHHPGVLSLLPEQFDRRDVQPVGRLDHDTTGLLLMSDDGPFIHRQSSPKYHVPKIYVARTHDAVSDELVAALQIEIVLAEGKYHQVKRMLAAAGNHCVALQRAQIGKLTLSDLGLAEGAWCYLSAAQRALLVAD